MTKENGFTLVELLVALAAGALLLVGLGALTGMFGHEVAAHRNSAFSDIANAAPILTSLLENAAPSDAKVARFEGDEAHLIAEVSPPLSSPASGPMHVLLKTAQAADGVALDTTMEPAEDRQVPGYPKTERLVRGMKDISFSYRRAPDARANDLPTLITIAFLTTKNERWDLAIQPQITESSGCRFDAITLTCQP